MAIKSQKFLPQGKVGGSLAVRPKANLVPIKKQSSSLANIGGKKEEPMLVIKTKVIKIEDILKGTLAAEKRAADEKRKAQEQEDRSKQENEVEAPKTKGKGIKIPVPGKIKSFWGNIQKYIGKVLFGWLALQLLPLLPKLMPIVKFLASTVDFIIKIGGTILKGLVTFIDWGYKAVTATEGWIKDKFGEDAADKFNAFMGTINKVLNLVIALGIGAAAMGRGKKPPKGPKGTKQPKRGPKNKLKRAQKKIKRFTDPKRADKLKRVKNIKKIRADKLARIKKIGRLRKIANAKKFVGKTTKAISKTSQAVSKTSQAVGKNVSKATKVVGKNVGKVSQSVGKNLSKVSGKISQSAGKVVTRLGMKMNTGMVQSMKGISKMAKGVRIPIVGPLLAALTSYLADGKWDKALFIGLGTALGEMLGTAIPIPVIGTLLGGAIGYYVGDLLYTLFRGGGASAVLKKLSDDIKKVLNVGAAVTKWAGKGFARFYEGIPKVVIPDFPKEPPKWIPGWVPRKKALWNIAKTGLKVLIGPLSLLMGKKIPILPWLMNPFETTPLLIKSFFSRDPIQEKVFDPVKAVSSFFKGDEKKDKKDKDKKNKKTTIKIESYSENPIRALASGDRSRIEQALYEMRIQANLMKGGYDYVGNPKYKKDVDLIMEHGLPSVRVNGGRVTLAKNLETKKKPTLTPVDVNSVAAKTNSISKRASYEESGEEVVVVNSTTPSGGGNAQQNETMPVETASAGGGDDFAEALYEGG